MKWNFLGFQNWPAANGELDLMQGFDVFRASLSSTLPRDTCEACVCWREYGTCNQVQVMDCEDTARSIESYGNLNCAVWKNCCPILFFDFVGVKLPKLMEEVCQ